MLVLTVLIIIFTSFKAAAEDVLQNNNSKLQKPFFFSPKVHYCTSTSECEQALGPSSTCIRTIGQCVCEMGYEEKPVDLNDKAKFFCEKRTCSAHSDCTEKWGSGARCSAFSCYCDALHYYNPTSQRCSARDDNEDNKGGSGGFGLKLGIPSGVAGFAVIAGIVLLYRWFASRRQLKEPSTVIYQNPPPLPPPPMAVRHQNPQSSAHFFPQPEVAIVSIAVVEFEMPIIPPPSPSNSSFSSSSSSSFGSLPKGSNRNYQSEPHSPPPPYEGEQSSSHYSYNQPPQPPYNNKY